MTRITLKAVTYLTVHFQLSQIIACNEDIRQLFTYLFVNLCVNKQRYDFAYMSFRGSMNQPSVI